MVLSGWDIATGEPDKIDKRRRGPYGYIQRRLPWLFFLFCFSSFSSFLKIDESWRRKRKQNKNPSGNQHFFRVYTSNFASAVSTSIVAPGCTTLWLFFHLSRYIFLLCSSSTSFFFQSGQQEKRKRKSERTESDCWSFCRTQAALLYVHIWSQL